MDKNRPRPVTNLELDRALATVRKEFKRELTAVLRENADLKSKVKNLSEKVGDIEDTSIMKNMLTIAKTHKKTSAKKRLEKVPKVTKKNQKSIDKAWEQLKADGNKEESRKES